MPWRVLQLYGEAAWNKEKTTVQISIIIFLYAYQINELNYLAIPVTNKIPNEKDGMTPLISVVIPTANRPHYLPRAVDSALMGMSPAHVEVLVIPNGPDESWRNALLCYKNNSNVRVIRITEANANIARNIGLAASRGEFVRFLDDDDYLIPEGAIKQYASITDSKADVISGGVQLVNERGRCFDFWHQPDTDDLCSAVLGPGRLCHPSAHIYRRSLLDKTRWNANTLVRQDFEWLFDLCAAMELNWKKIDDVVGVWQHHWGNRISSSRKFNSIRRMTVSMLLKTYETLKTARRLNQSRRRAISQGLWGCVQAAFFLEPRYWTRIAQVAVEIDPNARPVQAIYDYPIFRMINPLVIQYAMLPKRWAFHYFRQTLNKYRFRHSW